MAIKPIETLNIEGLTDSYSFIPVEPSESERGGIKASTTVDTEYELEVKMKADGKAYVSHDDAKLDSKVASTEAGKTMKVDESGNIVPVASMSDIEVEYIEDTYTLLIKNPGTGDIDVDSTLQTSGKAADAKSTGTEIEALKTRVKSMEDLIASLIEASKELY